MGEEVALLDTWYQADTNHAPPVSVLQPVDTRLKHFLNKKEPALQAQHRAAWWQVQSRLQGDHNLLNSSLSL